MRIVYAAVVLLATVHGAHAGDDASGPIPFSIDLSRPFTTYSMTQKDQLWGDSLVTNLKYKGPVVHFVRTSLLLKVGDASVEGAVYQAVEKPEFFYVVNSDAILKLNTKWAYSPGVGGFSMHAPKSRRFIVCLNLDGGVPFLSSSPVKKGVVTWNGHVEVVYGAGTHTYNKQQVGARYVMCAVRTLVNPDDPADRPEEHRPFRGSQLGSGKVWGQFPWLFEWSIVLPVGIRWRLVFGLDRRCVARSSLRAALAC